MSGCAPSISAKTRMAELLRVENLSAGYGEARVIQNLTFALEDGRSLALLGRNGVGKAGEQEGHARKVAVVLARLVGAAEDDLLHFVRKAGMTAHQLSDRQRRKIIRADAGQRPGVPADRGANIVADIGFSIHGLRTR